jgi:hypothetical protein
MKFRHTRSLISLAAAAFLASCASDSPTASAHKGTLDVAALLGQMSFGNVGALPGASSVLAIPTTTASPSFSPAMCSYSETVQGFVCPTVTNGGLTFNMSYFLYDAAGHSQSQPDAATTASIRTVADTKGTTSAPSTNGMSGTVMMSNHGDMTMAGLLTSTRMLNGNTTSHYDMSLTGTTPLHVVMDMATVTKDLALPSNPPAAQPWPLSGTITSDGTSVTTSGTTAAVTTTIHSVITFNGTSTATVVTSMTTPVGPFTMTCTMDLSGKAAPVCTSK